MSFKDKTEVHTTTYLCVLMTDAGQPLSERLVSIHPYQLWIHFYVDHYLVWNGEGWGPDEGLLCYLSVVLLNKEEELPCYGGCSVC